MSKGLKILIADDNDTDLMILRTIVRKEGHEVVLASNGQEALDLFREHRPDLVLLDVMMPVLDGIAVAQNIRSEDTYEYIPIIFLTSLRDAESLAKCLDSGGDDFLSKPYNRVVLKAKIKAFSRMRVMHEKLERHNRHMLIEQQIAKTIFDNVAHSGCLDTKNIRHSISPLSIFNGDTLLAERTPDGAMHLFVGDFTGHGLPAAIGAMPLAEIFYGMTVKGFSMVEILREMNAKLHRILPTGVFCCGCFIKMDFYTKKAELWLGGLPDIVCYRNAMKSIETLSSTNLPLGVLDRKKFEPSIQELDMENGDELFAWSDGIIESRNASDEFFGEERLLALFSSNESNSIFSQILTAIDLFTGETSAHDDVTLLSVKMVDVEELGEPKFSNCHGSIAGPPQWAFSFRLENDSLRVFNPLPMVLNVISEVEGLRSISGQLYTILTELFSNALEHGVLRLSSQLKSSPAGFATYYLEREKRLDSLESGFVEITAKHTPAESGKGGELILTLEDSGAGFDHKQVISCGSSTEGYSGRGLPLILGICSKFYFNEQGNQVTAHLSWPIQRSS